MNRRLLRLAETPWIAVCFVLATCQLVEGRTQDVVNCDGYPCVNFAFGANVSRQGDLFAKTFYNPPYLGAGLEPLGGGRLIVHGDGEALELSQFAERSVQRKWPLATVIARDQRIQGVTVQVRAFAPLAINDRFISSVPATMAEITLRNEAPQKKQLRLEFRSDDFLPEARELCETQLANGLVGDRRFICWAGAAECNLEEGSVSVDVEAEPGDTCISLLVLGRWDENYPCSARCTNAQNLVDYLCRFRAELRDAVLRLDDSMPHTEDEDLNDYLRWYATAGVAMTKTLKDGTALTMGYHELNQRDSFWTSWIHLVLWPAVERRMIEESVWGQRLDGKVPTTLLPLIEREDDADINCFFILRGLRYVRFHQDEEFGRKILPSLIQAADWLAGRDLSNAGLPEGTSGWFDWKDVPGMAARKYSPYTSMLYIAALERLALFLRETGDNESAERYERRLSRASALLNRSIDDGGLYNGHFYEHVWREAPPGPPRVSQDQVVGVVFDVIPTAKAQKLLDSLQPSLSEWGVRETYPYFDASFGYEPGDYHNGGIWPYLNHVHAWALLKAGRTKEAIELLKKVGRADLENAEDFIPHEYLHGETGQQAGVPMQGWNAAMFGAIYFGMQSDAVTP